jgi:copper homeostasis protein
MMQRDFLFEICANSVESCIAAQEAGADRVELCASMPEGGTTPSYGEIRQARELLKTTKLHVIIRPRAGDFVYTPLELERMINDIRLCQGLGVDGVVFGCLTDKGEVCLERNAILKQEAKGMSTTFHRAFDRCINPEESLERIIRLGFDRVLTSGQKPTAEEGIPMLKRLQEIADGRIAILAGSGINDKNIEKIKLSTGISEFHFSARENIFHTVDNEFGCQMQTTKRRIIEIISKLTPQEPKQ